MSSWKSYLNADPIDWLLEEDNPSVRYFTLKYILDKPENQLKLEDARENIMKIGVVPKILDKQEAGGYWGIPENFYIRGKYKGTSWQLIILAELGADRKDDRINSICEFMLENSQDPESGAFSYLGSKKGSGGDPLKILPCLTANMVWSLIRFGYLADERVKKAIEWLIKTQRFDDGTDKPPEGWPYDRWEKCWGRHTCHSIVVKTLRAFSEIPEKQKTSEIMDYIYKGAEFLLKHHIYKRSHDLKLIGHEKWLELGFPLLWDFDILEVLLILIKLGFKDERMQDAVNILISKQDDNGKWILERNFNGRMQVSIERKGKPSKWITLKALQVLKGYYQ